MKERKKERKSGRAGWGSCRFDQKKLIGIRDAPSVLVSAVLGALALWIQNPKKNSEPIRCLTNKKCENERMAGPGPDWGPIFNFQVLCDTNERKKPTISFQ